MCPLHRQTHHLHLSDLLAGFGQCRTFRYLSVFFHVASLRTACGHVITKLSENFAAAGCRVVRS